METLHPRDESPTVDVELHCAPVTPSIARSYAVTKVRRLLGVAPGPVLHAAVRLSPTDDPAPELRWNAKATFDVNGRVVRAHATGSTALEAVDVVQQRLHDRLLRLAARRRGLRSRPSEGRTAGRGVPPRRDRDDSVDTHAVVWRRTLAGDPSTLDEAACDLDMLDVEFLLFRHAGSGRDAVLHRREDGRLGLAWYGAAPDRLEPTAPELAADLVAEPAPPTSSLADALERLEAGGEAHVAVTDAATGRPIVVHRRWDGNYGVVAPSDEPAPPAGATRAGRRLFDELRRLESVRTALRGEGLDAMTECEDLAELSGADQHPADLGTETFERTRDLCLLHEVEAELDDVHHALRRLGDGTYGRCEACGAPIPDERLAAVPAARLCVAHEAQAERAAADARSGVRPRR